LLAAQFQPSDLPLQTWDEHTYGTNVQHGLMLARQLLAQSNAQTRQIIIVTTGEEPTAHLEPGEPYPVFNYPPTQRCIAETLREVERATRENIVITTFMLQPSRGPSSFVEQMTSINGGSAFYGLARPPRGGPSGSLRAHQEHEDPVVEAAPDGPLFGTTATLPRWKPCVIACKRSTWLPSITMA
jgi:hypothetical protein